MSGTTISGKITHAVTLGSSPDYDNVTVTNTGTIATAKSPAVYSVSYIGHGISPTLTNYGDIVTGGNTFAVNAKGFLDAVYNYGTIRGASGLYVSDGGTISNAGTIIGTSSFGVSGIMRLLTNSGAISGSKTGVNLSNGSLANSGDIYGGLAGVSVSIAGVLSNTGSIGGGLDGVIVTGAYNASRPANIFNAGTISGGVDAIFDGTANLALTVAPGAVFEGYVVDQQGHGQLILGASSTVGSLDIAGSFSGFDNLIFGAGGTWTLEGATGNLASGQIIGGFQGGDKIVLDGFVATSETFVAGVGLELRNGATTKTLALTTQFPGESFGLTNDGVNSTITAYGPDTGEISTISGDFIGQVTPGVNNYAAVITLASTATLTPHSGAAVFVKYGEKGATITNDGQILTPNNISNPVTFASHGVLINNGTISGREGVDIQFGTLINTGLIQASGGAGAVVAQYYANIFNSGTLASVNFGVTLNGGGTLENSGLISGQMRDEFRNTSVAVYSNGPLWLTVEPGAAFAGEVFDYDGLYLTAAGTGTGSLDITSFLDVVSISFGSGSDWTLEGNHTDFAAGQPITGFSRGDTIVLDGFVATGHIFLDNKLVVFNSAASQTLDIIGSFSTSDFIVTADGAGGTVIEEVTCFARGTRIATPQGEVAVESLKLGDLVATMHAGPQKIRWIGVRSYAAPFANHKKVLPVCVKASALADGVPARDLFVSPGHALFVDGILVHVDRLVNGVSIVQAEAVEAIDYFHIELETHELLFAEGCPAESFAGEYFRACFHNAAEFALLHPDKEAPEHLCLPLISSGFQLEALRQRLAARAGVTLPPAAGALRGFIDRLDCEMVSGWAQRVGTPEVPVCLDIIADDVRVGRVLANLYRSDVAAQRLGNGYQGFEFCLPPDTPGPIIVRCAETQAMLSFPLSAPLPAPVAAAPIAAARLVA